MIGCPAAATAARGSTGVPSSAGCAHSFRRSSADARVGHERATVRASSISPAAMPNIARQPAISAMMLATGRDSMMPASSPDMTLPIVRPCVSCGASDAANGTTICTPADVTPTSAEAARNSVALGRDREHRQRRGRQPQGGEDQPAVLEPVGERHDEQQPDRVAELGQRHDQPGGRPGPCVVPGRSARSAAGHNRCWRPSRRRPARRQKVIAGEIPAGAASVAAIRSCIFRPFCCAAIQIGCERDYASRNAGLTVAICAVSISILVRGVAWDCFRETP